MNSMNDKNLKTHEEVLEALAEAIDIPDHLLEKATERYEAIGRHLDRDGSSISHLDPVISPQGSMLLGTVIRPVGDADEFDFDLVCTVNGNKHEFTQAELKGKVGDEIKGYAKANNMNNPPEEGRRCWILTYSDGEKFHMDILPAIPDRQAYRTLLESRGYAELAADASIVDNAIAITDREHPNYNRISNDWLVSNPKGYAAWFRSRQVVELERRKKRLVEGRIYASVEEVPDHKVKTPLQRAIQLLKRHRDSIFNGQENKPISIIISTLAGHSYNGERTISDTLQAILENMDRYIIQRGDTKWICNPVNPDENFADKWVEYPERERAFYDWLDKARNDFGRFLSAPISNTPQSFQAAMTEGTMSKVTSRIAVAAPAVVKTALPAEAAQMRERGADHKPWTE